MRSLLESANPLGEYIVLTYCKVKGHFCQNWPLRRFARRGFLCSMTRLLLLIIALLAPISLLAQDQPASDVNQEPENPYSEVSFRNPAGFQMEVWVNGNRLGFTPLTVRLQPGPHWISISADSIIPIMQTTMIRDKPSQVVHIPPAPVTRDDYVRVQNNLNQTILNGPKDPHLILIALHLCIDVEEGYRLLERMDRGMPGDPMGEFLRGMILLMDDQPDDALAATERGLAKLPKVAFGWRVRAEALAELGQLEEAIDAANQAMIEDPHCWRNLRIRAKIHELAGNTIAAEADAERAEEMYRALFLEEESGPQPAGPEAPSMAVE